ncbi:hypothetical protein [Halorubrum halophilum]|uniref:capsular polysaccharide export protein, LipB/KpsS family n=1 Tax=Halorubrum halophilum TaxID=413816 RepID=UPI00186B0DF3|nr:hypothetical protein [Halorubrum halophilum]
MNIAIADVQTPYLSHFWYSIGKNLQENGHSVYFVNPRKYFERFLSKQNNGFQIYTNDDVTNTYSIESGHGYVLQYHSDWLGKDTQLIKEEYSLFRGILEEHNIDVSVFWNEKDLGVLAAKDTETPRVHLENGYLPKTIQIDNQGVNCNSSIADLQFQDILSIDPIWESNFDISAKSYPHDSMSSIDRLKVISQFPLDRSAQSHLRRTIGSSVIKLKQFWSASGDQELPEDPFVFLPFQVHDDSQVMYNTGYINSMPEFLNLVKDSLRDIDEDLNIVIKEHPHDIGRISYEELRKNNPDVTWLKDYPIEDVIQKSSLVVTLNSSVGFQSIAANRPVVTLGKSLYNNYPHVYHAPESDMLAPQLRKSLKNGISEEAAREYIESFRENIFIPGSFEEYTESTLSFILNYILKTAQND